MSVGLKTIRKAAEAAQTLPISIYDYQRILESLPRNVTDLLCQSGDDDKWRLLLDPQTVLRMVAVCEAAKFYDHLYPAFDDSVPERLALTKAVRALGEGEGGEKR